MTQFSFTLLVLSVGLLMAMNPVSLLAADTASEMSMIVSNGPTASRINFVLLAEGYLDAEHSKFHEDAKRVVDSLLSAEPMQSYVRFYNAFGIFVAS